MKPLPLSVFHSVSNPVIMHCFRGVPPISSRNLNATAVSHVTVIWTNFPLNETHRSLNSGGPTGVARKSLFSEDDCCIQSSHDLLGVLCGAGVQLLSLQTPPTFFGVEACGSSHQYVVYVISGTGVQSLLPKSPPASLLGSSLAHQAKARDSG